MGRYSGFPGTFSGAVPGMLVRPQIFLDQIQGRESFPDVVARVSVCVGKGLPTYGHATL
ncbi:uncharacterized protein sS8_3413 [Methylocaldum marinum]|uniref:Uncharacterized protein n=1 Tax=Methylocaldum marinum TaxID=1432792 RepID=A0A250KWK3_9GAMM|nr:hypothetical protein [Methylocaldum marinum]BBA35351.1 uncharacterized protein sS8_3413 [Methylocaldum marinum]